MTSTVDELEVTAQAFVDNELTSPERLAFLERLTNDARLREQVVELLYQKELVRRVFSDIPEPASAASKSPLPGSEMPRVGGVLALLVLLLAMLGGGLAAGFYIGSRYGFPAPIMAAAAVRRPTARASGDSIFHVITAKGVATAHSLAQLRVLQKTDQKQRMPMVLMVDDEVRGVSESGAARLVKRLRSLVAPPRYLSRVARTASRRGRLLKTVSPSRAPVRTAFPKCSRIAC